VLDSTAHKDYYKDSLNKHQKINQLIVEVFMQTMDEAKISLRENWDKGIDCPCCGQRVQRYNYSLYATSALALIRLYRLTQNDRNQDWFHVNEYAEAMDGKARASHFTELRYWGLIEKRPFNENPAKKSSGFWRITSKGVLFVLGHQALRSRFFIYNNRFLGFDEDSDMITIRDALGTKFDYQTLMGGDDK
jgi:hypothetical protein